MSSIFEWNQSLRAERTFPTSGLQFWPYTFPIFPPKSLQRFVVRLWVTGAFGQKGSGAQAFPVPYDWSLAIYATDTTGYFRSYYNGGWNETLTGFADADVGGWNTVGTVGGPGPLEVDQTVRKAAPPGPGAELDLHVDVAASSNAALWTAAKFEFEREFWLDVSYLTSEPGL